MCVSCFVVDFLVSCLKLIRFVVAVVVFFVETLIAFFFDDSSLIVTLCFLTQLTHSVINNFPKGFTLHQRVSRLSVTCP